MLGLDWEVDASDIITTTILASLETQAKSNYSTVNSQPYMTP